MRASTASHDTAKWLGLFVLSLWLGLVASSSPVGADTLEVQRPTYFRSGPQSTAPAIERLATGKTLQLLDDGARDGGYYRAYDPETSTIGYVYKTFVRREEAVDWIEPSSEQGAEAHCPLACPVGRDTTNKIIHRSIYSLSANPETKFADWVAYTVTPKNFGPSRHRYWRTDPGLDAEETMEAHDFTDAYDVIKTDRGHQAPLASFAGTPVWHETNYLSNITPQKSALNQGPWKHLEAAVRDLASRSDIGSAYVATGPLYEREMPPLPKSKKRHAVPSGYWKLVLIDPGEEVRYAAFILDQATPRSADFCDHEVTADEVETRSGFDLMSALGNARERDVEATFSDLRDLLGCPPRSVASIESAVSDER